MAGFVVGPVVQRGRVREACGTCGRNRRGTVARRRANRNSDYSVRSTVSEKNDEEGSGKGPEEDEGEEGKMSETDAADSEEEYNRRAEISPEDVSGIRLIFGSETFFATEVLSPPGGLIFRGNLRGEPMETLAKLDERLKSRFGDKYTICLAEGEEDRKPMVVVVPAIRDRRPSSYKQKLVSVLAIIACIIPSVCKVAYRIFGVEALTPQVLLSPMFRYQIFPLGLAVVIMVLLSHFSRKMMATMLGARVSPPIMLPSYSLGTYGCITSINSPVSNREHVFDIAFFGSGILIFVSLAMFGIGVTMSTSPAAVLTVPSSMVTDSLMFSYVTKYVLGPNLLRSAGRELVGLHWLAILGANCATIAALNLLPIRQLDGGRMVSAIYGRKTAMLASRITIFLLLMSTPNSAHLLLFLGFVLFGPWVIDRPARNELSEPDFVHTSLCVVCLVLMMLVLLPMPATMKLF